MLLGDSTTDAKPALPLPGKRQGTEQDRGGRVRWDRRACTNPEWTSGAGTGVQRVRPSSHSQWSCGQIALAAERLSQAFLAEARGLRGFPEAWAGGEPAALG
jgi:hypothetical protein